MKKAAQKLDLNVPKGTAQIRPSLQRRVCVSCTVSDQKARSKRGVLILPGLGNNLQDYTEISKSLEDYGLVVKTAHVSRLDWSRNAAALTDINWWKGTLKPRPAVEWYLTLVNEAMQKLKAEVDGAPITMLTHSAGGWLGRVYLKDFGTEGVDRFVSLGSPHMPPPDGVIDQTRGILTFVNDTCPGAFHPEVSYVTISGRFVHGVPLEAEGSFLAKFAGLGYTQVCGQSEVWGDFIVPEPSAHLEGAEQLRLDDVFHSPLGEKLPFFGPWYGSQSVLPRWFHHITGEGESIALSSGSMLGSSNVQPAAVVSTLPSS